MSVPSEQTEALHIAFQCGRPEGFHISLDLVTVREIVDAGNTLGPGGTGDIVISNLTNRATLLLIYKPGAVVTLGQGPCPCGRTLPTVARIEGRADDLAIQPGGQKIHALSISTRRPVHPGHHPDTADRRGLAPSPAVSCLCCRHGLGAVTPRAGRRAARHAGRRYLSDSRAGGQDPCRVERQGQGSHSEVY